MTRKRWHSKSTEARKALKEEFLRLNGTDIITLVARVGPSDFHNQI